MADIDGCVVVPKAVSEKVVDNALDIAARKTKTRDELIEGAGLYDVFKKYGTT